MPEKYLSIGRSRVNDIIVDNPYVSARHCRLTRTGNGFLIEDLGSKGGTFVNGARVSMQMVNFGDSIELSHRFRLDWNHPVLQRWMMALDRSEPVGFHGESYARMNPYSRKTGVAEMPSWLLTIIGSFFFVFYLIPIYDNTFMWDWLEHSFSDGVGFLFIALAGLAVPVIAYTIKGLGRSISVASIGFIGLVLYFVSAGNALEGMPFDNGFVVGLLSILLLCGMMSQNNVVISLPGNRSTRLTAGIAASVYMGLLTVTQILSLIEMSDYGSGSALVVVFSILGYLAHLSVGILLAVNIRESPSNRRIAIIAERILIYTIMTQILAFSFGMLIEFHGADGGWLFFLMFRILGFVFGLCIILSGGVADIIKQSNFLRRNQ